MTWILIIKYKCFSGCSWIYPPQHRGSKRPKHKQQDSSVYSLRAVASKVDHSGEFSRLNRLPRNAFFWWHPPTWRYRIIFHWRCRWRVSTEGNVWNKTTCAATSNVYQKRKGNPTTRSEQARQSMQPFSLNCLRNNINKRWLRWFSWFFFYCTCNCLVTVSTMSEPLYTLCTTTILKGIVHPKKMKFPPFATHPDLDGGSGDITVLELHGGKEFRPVEVCCGQGHVPIWLVWCHPGG